MLERDLSISIITYNRAARLSSTLEQLAASPFAQCAITILDNCSTDETPAVCAAYTARFPDLRVVRHTRNIGAPPNYLRAVELSEAKYSWILCDDDTFDFSTCGDVIAAIESAEADLIYVGGTEHVGWPAGVMRDAASLVAITPRYLLELSFIPSIIFRSALFDSSCMTLGYRMVAEMYPHFPFLLKTIDENVSIYLSAARIVYRGADENVLSSLTWYAAWVSSCARIRDPKLRRLSMFERPQRTSWARSMAEWIMSEKLDHPERIGESLRRIRAAMSLDQRLVLYALHPLAVIPTSAYRLARLLRRKSKGRSYTEEKKPFDLFRL
jgi:hypothetical protein